MTPSTIFNVPQIIKVCRTTIGDTRGKSLRSGKTRLSLQKGSLLKTVSTDIVNFRTEEV